jgi:RNA polymerase-binding transcription factor DksA
MTTNHPDKPSDPLDVASEQTLADTARGVEAVRSKTAPQAHPDFDGEHCLECAEPIPLARLELGRILCVDCQTLKERDDALMGRG